MLKSNSPSFVSYLLIAATLYLGACASTLHRSESASTQALEVPYDLEEPIGSIDSLDEIKGKAVDPAMLAPQKFRWPLLYPEISSYFGWRSGKVHEGIDLRGPVGTRVYATGAGKIIAAGRRIRGYGKIVMVDHGEGWTSLYAHLSKSKVKIGQQVHRGQLIGLVGRTGRTRGPHLHFEIRKGADPMDPLVMIEKKSSVAGNRKESGTGKN